MIKLWATIQSINGLGERRKKDSLIKVAIGCQIYDSQVKTHRLIVDTTLLKRHFAPYRKSCS